MVFIYCDFLFLGHMCVRLALAVLYRQERLSSEINSYWNTHSFTADAATALMLAVTSRSRFNRSIPFRISFTAKLWMSTSYMLAEHVCGEATHILQWPASDSDVFHMPEWTECSRTAVKGTSFSRVIPGGLRQVWMEIREDCSVGGSSTKSNRGKERE